jgi:uncharacterized membrane protein YkvA (DUF1232 family)
MSQNGSPQRAKWREWARRLKRDIYALYLAGRDPRVPWYARAVAVCVVAYAFSPLDLIPDFIPVLGLVDDLILVPLGLALAIRLIPPAVLADCRARAAARLAERRPVNWYAAGLIVAVWVSVAALAVWLALRLFAR